MLYEVITVDLGTVNIDITAVNDAPVLTTSSSISTFSEGGSAVIIDSFMTVTDVDNTTLEAALIFISRITSYNVCYTKLLRIFLGIISVSMCSFVYCSV